MKNSFKILPFILILGLGLNSCKKEKDTKKCDTCSISGTVMYLPIGCVGNSTTLGIKDEEGNYYFVKKDLTNKFGNYLEGANICFDFNVQENCNIILQAGFMAIPIQCIELTCIGECKKTECYTVEYLPTQCVYNEITGTLGLKDSKGQYYMIKEDLTNAFKSYKAGDMVKARFVKKDDCIVCFSCHCPSPDYCIVLKEISSCDSDENPRCLESKEVDYNTFNKLKLGEYHNIENMRVEGNHLKFYVSFSGCDDEVKPTLYINSPKLGAPFSILNCKLIFNRAPQPCDAAFRKELCYDLGDLLKQNPKNINIITKNGQETLNLW